MDKIYIGKIVSTHGIKGEVRIISNFKYKTIAFNKNNELIINDNNYVIESYRVHKIYDMIKFKDYNNINDVLNIINKKVYIDRKYLNKISYLDEDLIGMNVIYNNKNIGVIESVENIKNNPIIIVKTNDEKKYIPNNKDFIEKIDLSQNKVYIKYMEGLI